MATDHAFYVWVLCDQGLKLGCTLKQTNGIHVANQRLERWVVHGYFNRRALTELQLLR